jgi:photosystem II stability/assembly factor-like uncharacterized protein
MSSDRLLVATRKGVFVFRRSSARRWEVASTSFLGANASLVMHDPRDGSIVAALEHGHFGCKLHVSNDGGTTWDERAVPKYPEKPVDFVDMDEMRGVPREWKLKKIWALAPGGADQPGRWWAGTIPGGLFRSDDHGRTWTLNEPLWHHPTRTKWFGGGEDQPGIHSICVDPRDSRTVLVGVSTAGVWRTHDDGASWEQTAHGMRAEYMPPEQSGEPLAQDVHCMVQCPTAPEAMWVQHHNGIFRSTDAGRSWTELREVPPSVFGFAVAVHPERPETAWFVPAQKDEQRIPVDGKVVVSRTRDGGRTWDVLREGLPQVHAYDLTFRHGLDVDPSGERLAFGSSTGGLWLSEDAGDSWITVNAHLPQIHAVRFA